MIEINRAKSIYVYRLNPFNPRVIDRRENKHNARWATYANYATEEIARATLLQLERKQEIRKP